MQFSALRLSECRRNATDTRWETNSRLLWPGALLARLVWNMSALLKSPTAPAQSLGRRVDVGDLSDYESTTGFAATVVNLTL